MENATSLRSAQHSSSGRPVPRIAAIQHAVLVLSTFSTAEPLLGVNEIARRVGVHKSTASRILVTLEDARLVERDELSGRYRLGAGIVALAGPLLANLSVRTVALPHLQRLAEASRESVSLSIWNHGEAVNVEQILGPGSIKHIAPVGMRSPAHCTANGKVFLAYAPPSEVDAVLAGPLERYTRRTIVEREPFLRELEQVRRLGYSVNVREFEENLIAASAPIRDHRGEVVAACGISAPAFGTEGEAERLEQFGRLSRETADAISAHLGYVPLPDARDTRPARPRPPGSQHPGRG